MNRSAMAGEFNSMLVLEFEERSALSLEDVEILLAAIPVDTPSDSGTLPLHCIGTINYRGSTSPVIDLALMFGGRFAGRTFGARIAVCSTKGKLYGLAVDNAVRVAEARSIDSSESEDAQFVESDGKIRRLFIPAVIARECGL